MWSNLFFIFATWLDRPANYHSVCIRIVFLCQRWFHLLIHPTLAMSTSSPLSYWVSFGQHPRGKLPIDIIKLMTNTPSYACFSYLLSNLTNTSGYMHRLYMIYTPHKNHPQVHKCLNSLLTIDYGVAKVAYLLPIDPQMTWWSTNLRSYGESKAIQPGQGGVHRYLPYHMQ